MAVNETSERNSGDVSVAVHELLRLHEQTVQAHGALHRLQRDITEAENHLGSTRTALMVQANEKLLLAIEQAKKEAEAAAKALSAASPSDEFDALTQLPNRTLLLDRFLEGIADAGRHGSRLALLYLDLENFRQINDELGQAVGDYVLKLAALRLASSVRATDTVSRHGADRFLILLAEVSEPVDAGLLAGKVLAALGAPTRVGDRVFRLAGRVGISIYPDDGGVPDVLIDKAEAALYRAKRAGVDRVVFFGDPADASASPEVWPASPPTHGVVITHHERRYGLLREANAQLVSAALGAQELQAAAEKTQLRQTELLALVAHELRNPLNPLRAAAALLGRAGSHELPRLRAIIERQVQRLSRLAGDLLDVSRVSTGKLRIELQPLELTSVVDEAVQACRPAIDVRLQTLRVQLPACALHVNGDPIRLVQVLGNLLDNASKYTPDGGTIALSVGVAGAAVVITVSDSGIGMTREALASVFSPFVQEPHAVSFNKAGLGLGLTLVRELVQAHGGTVAAHSAGPGQGSTFVVTLPLAAPPGEPPT